MTETPRPNPGPYAGSEPGDTLRMPSSEGMAGTTHRYEPGYEPGYQSNQQPYQQPGFESPSSRGGSRPTKGVVAGIVAASLVVGGLAGLAGAAGYSAFNDSAGGGAQQAAPSAGDVPQVSDSPDIPAAEGSAEKVAASVLPSVVKINVITQQGGGSGSGIILSEDGEILTNNHVVDAAGGGGTISVSFNDGSTARAKVIGTDPLTDVAVIKAEDVSGQTPAKIGNSDQLYVGENVVAIGSPFGLQATVTSGIVSALNRPVSAGEQGGTDTTYPAIQTDAAINPGNSGGPLVNMRGEVVGINSSIRTASSGVMGGEAGSIGLGFAIPIGKVLPIVDQLRNGETPTHARLGVTVADAASNDGLLTGAGVQTVADGSAADKAGLRRGDVITKVDDQIISDSESLVAMVRGYRPGDKVTLTVVRGDGDNTSKVDPITIDVTLDSDGGQAAS
jgi:putative serine protease PepD